MSEFNFIHEDRSISDEELFFGPLAVDEKFIRFPSNWKLENIMVAAGIFKSLTQARKNNMSGEIPGCFSRYVAGKKRTEINILNRPTDGWKFEAVVDEWVAKNEH